MIFVVATRGVIMATAVGVTLRVDSTIAPEFNPEVGRNRSAGDLSMTFSLSTRSVKWRMFQNLSGLFLV